MEDENKFRGKKLKTVIIISKIKLFWGHSETSKGKNKKK